MVAHHEDPVRGHHDLEPHVGRVDLHVVGVDVQIRVSSSGMPLTVIRFVASRSTPPCRPGMPDHPLDQVPRRALGRQPDELQHLVERSGLARPARPASRPGSGTRRRRRGRTSVIFCTTTRSPMSRVFSIDSDGMMNICPTKARSRDDTIIAPTRRSAVPSRRTLPDDRALLGCAATPILRGTRCRMSRGLSTVGLGSGGDLGRLPAPAGRRAGRCQRYPGRASDAAARTARPPRSRGPPPDLRTRTHSAP